MSFTYIFAVDTHRLRNPNLGHYCKKLTKAQDTRSRIYIFCPQSLFVYLLFFFENIPRLFSYSDIIIGLL